jgi:hypothetical protein
VSGMVDNTAWLAGYERFARGEGCPWGDESARLGWIAARDEADVDKGATL